MLALVGLAVLTGLDHRVESVFVAAMPNWLAGLATTLRLRRVSERWIRRWPSVPARFLLIGAAPERAGAAALRWRVEERLRVANPPAGRQRRCVMPPST
jgi:hypothetical protein